MRRLLGFMCVLACACGDDDGGATGGADAAAGTPDAGATIDAAAAGPPTAMAFPQAIGGAMYIDPSSYLQARVHVVVTGGAESVIVTIEGAVPTDALDEDGDGDFIAMVPLGGVAPGAHAVHAVARGRGVELTADAELVVGSQGVQLTDFAVAGGAASPRLHRRGAELWVTWADRVAGPRQPWLRQLDGAGRFVGDAVALLPGTTQASEVLYARAAFGQQHVGLLFQRSGGPYTNFLTIVDTAGHEVLAPIALDPPGRYGSFGGEIAFDGAGFVAVYRTNDGMGGGEVRWVRVDEATGAVTGPVVVAASGNDDPNGGFQPFSFVSLAVAGDTSLVGFVRERWDAVLELGIPKSQVVAVHADGTVGAASYAGNEADFTWHDECRVFAVPTPDGDRFLALWSNKDLTSPLDTPPTRFHAALGGMEGALEPPRLVVNAADHRVEPSFLAGAGGALGALAWLDERSYVNLAAGRIELFVAPVGADLLAGEAVVFDHARFIEGTAELRTAGAGPNVILVWLDERHGNGLVDPRPELWFETAWF